MTATTAPFVQRSALDELLALHFPLLPRTRPSCRPLHSRIAHVEDLVQQAQQPTADTLARAAEAHNFSALIASDCGLAALARELCQRQHTAIRATTPVGVAHAKLTLQPLINLGRLHTRAGDGTAAYQVLHALFDTVQRRSTARIDGITFDARHLVLDAEHPELVQWLWAVLLADGTRALARAGRWEEASQHAEQHHGVGTRLLDGRQVTIIATHPQTALAMLAATDTAAPWERAIAACLTTICRIRLQQCTDADIGAMVDAYHTVEPDTTDPVFHVRLGLTAATLAAGHPAAAELLGRVEGTATGTTDAYIARDVLAAAHLLPVADRTMQDMTETVQQAGLGAGDIPPTLLNRLLQATDTAERLISATVRSATPPAEMNQRPPEAADA
ncbi:hypothetical protein AB0K00_40320 [Dactylosporangium sp. NPDC049525]|uniref:hypothetical protein n=1 Tax=Dactylosporangium sp. NPDC049525 TaxID=3154730 RepID=UPI00341EC5AB